MITRNFQGYSGNLCKFGKPNVGIEKMLPSKMHCYSIIIWEEDSCVSFKDWNKCKMFQLLFIHIWSLLCGNAMYAGLSILGAHWRVQFQLHVESLKSCCTAIFSHPPIFLFRTFLCRIDVKPSCDLSELLKISVVHKHVDVFIEKH